MQVGFIGLGRMGEPMAARIAAAGHALVVADADHERTSAVAGAIGARAAATVREVAQRADIVITMLPNSDVVESVLTGEDGVLASIAPGTAVVDMGSSHPMRTRALEPFVSGAGGTFLDAPVSGGVPRAKTGQLAIMVGGDSSAITRVRPVLEAMGDKIMPTGKLGSAHAMKALNNLVSAAGFLAGIEALLVGKQFGINPDTIVDVLNASTGVNNSTQKKFKQFVLSGMYDSGFAMDLMVKDIEIALGIADDLGVRSSFSEACFNVWREAARTLGPGRDHTELARWLQQQVGVMIDC